LITIACVHYQFEAIHPFVDGNGRVGRLLVSLLLIEWGLLPAPLLDISARLEPLREEYYARLLAVSTDGDWAGWLEFFLDAVRVRLRSTSTSWSRKASSLSSTCPADHAGLSRTRSSTCSTGDVKFLDRAVRAGRQDR
jgi:Fic family protein